METDAKIYVAGHTGMVGSAIVRHLQAEGYSNLALKTSSELDLRNYSAVGEFFSLERPVYVFLAAAKVGGICANQNFPAEFIFDNLGIQSAVIDQAHRNGVRKLLFLGSSCIYPRNAPQPISESVLLTGALERTNEAYAVAKIAGIKMCQAYREQYGCNFITAMPTNLYGPGDNYDLETSHVVPALIRKFYEAKRDGVLEVELWGDGSPRREFLYADDMAAACHQLMLSYGGQDPINVGTGKDITILELAQKIRTLVGYPGSITFDSSKPNGCPAKRLDVSKLRECGFTASTSLDDGLKFAVKDFILNYPGYTADERR